MKILDEIRTIVARETASKPQYLESKLSEAFAALLGPGIGNVLEKTYRQYVIQIGGQALVSDAEKLTWMRPFEIAAAPELLALLPADNHLVLVGRYWACTDEQLVPVVRSETVFSPEAGQRFKRDIVTLAEQGMWHPFAGRGYAHWIIGEVSGTIALNTWTRLSPIDPDERDRLFRRVDKLLAEQTRHE